MEDTQRVLVATGAEGRIEVRSPGVGLWCDAPAEGAPLEPGSPVGYLRRGRRRIELRLPEGARGRVNGAPRDRRVGVEYAAVLFRLLPFGEPTVDLAPEPAEDGRIVRAPTDGVFYARPTPQAAPFVAVGERVRTGQTVGLVEVMKTFGPIVYGGPDLPEEAEVVEIRCADGQEVTVGQALIVVR